MTVVLRLRFANHGTAGGGGTLIHCPRLFRLPGVFVEPTQILDSVGNIGLIRAGRPLPDHPGTLVGWFSLLILPWFLYIFARLLRPRAMSAWPESTVAWNLGTGSSYLSGTHLVFQGRYGIPSWKAAMWSWPYAMFMFVLAASWLHLVARLIPAQG